MKNLYCCNTYYHLLISIIKSIKNNQSNSLLLFSDIHNVNLILNYDLIERIKMSNIFDDVIIFDYSSKEINIEKRKFSSIYRFFLTKKIAREDKFNFKQFDNIYNFFDCSLLGHVLSQQHIYYTLLEDGTDTFKLNFKRLSPKKNLKYYIKNYLNFPDYAQSKYIKEIEVNSKEDLNIYGKKIVELSKEMLFKSLQPDEKKKIMDIFLPNVDLKKYNDCVLLITQPLSEDKIVENEVQKIEIYKEIIAHYAPNEFVFIKTHPREVTDYSNYFNKDSIINDIFPVELINFYPINLKKIITLSSTSINCIYNCKQKIILGWDYLKNIKDSE